MTGLETPGPAVRNLAKGVGFRWRGEVTLGDWAGEREFGD